MLISRFGLFDEPINGLLSPATITRLHELSNAVVVKTPVPLGNVIPLLVTPSEIMSTGSAWAARPVISDVIRTAIRIFAFIYLLLTISSANQASLNLLEAPFRIVTDPPPGRRSQELFICNMLSRVRSLLTRGPTTYVDTLFVPID